MKNARDVGPGIFSQKNQPQMSVTGLEVVRL